MSPTHLTTDLVQAGPDTRNLGAQQHLSPTVHTPPSAQEGTSLQAQLALQPRRKSLSGSQTRKEPETNAASDGQWREFYYYPIITLGSMPK